MNNPNVYVIVVTYNGMRWLDRCFGSIAASELPVKTIVLDNGSTDGTVEALRERYPGVELIETGANLGFGRANNMGIRRAMDAGCDYVYLLNQDAWIDPDTIGRLVGIQQDNPEYFILSPIQLTGDRDRPDPNFLKQSRERKCPGYLKDVERGEVKPLYPTTFVMAAHWLLPRKSLETIGGFAPVFPHSGEDNNYFHRLIYHGYKGGICPGIYAVHDRAGRKASPENMIRALYITFLIKTCNINRNLLRVALSTGWNMFKTIPAYMFRYRSVLPLSILRKDLLAVGEIMETRRQTKKTGPNYL